MKPIILPLLAAALVCQAGAARAQTAASAVDAGVVEPPRASLAVPLAGPSSLGTTLGGGAEIETGSDDGALSIWLSWTNSARLAGDKATYDLGTLRFSAPIDENAPSEMSARLDTLSNAATVEFKFSHVQARGLRRGTPVAELQAACGRAKALYAAKRGVKLDEDLSCAAAAADDPAMNAAWEDLFWKPAASALTFGLAGKVGHQKFDYLETATLAEQSQSKAVWSVSAFATHATREGRLLVSAGFEHQDAYEAADQKTLCPAAAAPPVTCAVGAYGAPVHKRSDIVSLEGRAIFGPGLGVVAKLNHDFNDDVWGIEVPVYFVRSPSKEALNGGLKFGWRSDDHDLVVSLFFGKAFPSLNF